MVSFGIATLTTPVSRSRAKRFDCGRYGNLTAKEIAVMTGMSREGVWQRVRAGVTGKDLCAPKHDGLRKIKKPCKQPVVTLAMKLARAFPDKVPSLREIRATHPMCLRQAQRWRQAMVECSEVVNG